MPIFEYKCLDCGKDFELIVRSDTKIACDNCGSENLKKKFSSFAVQTASTNDTPSCAGRCGNGFNHGRCGSGMCGMD